MKPTPHAPSRSAAEPKWHPTDYLRILYRRRWVAIPGFLLVLVSGALSSVRTVPVFEARTQLLIEKESRRATSIDTVLQDRDSYYDDDFYPTQHKLIQSRSLALRTVEALDRAGVKERMPDASGISLSPGDLVRAVRRGVSSLLSREETGNTIARRPADETAAQAGRVEGFLGSLQVVPVRSSRLVDLKFRSPDAAYAARAVNQLAEEYKRQSLELRSLASDEANSFLSQRLEEQRRKVEESEKRLQAFREDRNAISVDNRQNIVFQRLSDLNAQVTRARTTRLEKEGIYTTLRDMQARGAALDSFPSIMSNTFIQGLKNDVVQLEREQAQLVAAGFGSSYPGMLAVAGKLETSRARLKSEIDKVVESVRADFLSAQAAETELTKALEAQKHESLGVDRKALEYATIERETAGDRQLYDTLMQRANETGVSRQFTGSNIQVVDRAEMPQFAVLPDVRRDLLFATLGGLFLALALAIGVEFFDNRIKSPEEIKMHLGLPCLGMVPMIAGKEHSGETPLLSADSPPAFSEAIRSVRTAVLFSSAEEGARSLVVTSAGPHEGKTLISSSLAVALAQTGQRTILIDADMRRPRVHEVLGRSQEPGLSNVLVGESALGDAVRLTSVDNLSVLAAGHIPPNPAELLGSKKFDELIASLKTRFDWVVVDAPPVMPVTDASVLAHSASGVLFVVGAEMTPRQTAAAAVEQLRSSGAKFVGVVLNRVNVHRHSYYYSPYYKKEYAKYYQRTNQA
jgi:capsular exopolysaccharide synthesis family protein